MGEDTILASGGVGWMGVVEGPESSVFTTGLGSCLKPDLWDSYQLSVISCQSKRVWNNKSVVESITRDAFSSTDDWKKIQIFRVASQRECEGSQRISK